MTGQAENRKRIALIVPGGIGTGAGNLGVPVLEQIAQLLALQFEVTVFSLFQVNRDYKPEGFNMISISGENLFTKAISLLRKFNREHRSRKFSAVHGFWVLPSGLMAVLLGKIFVVRSIVSVLGGDGVAVPHINYGELRFGYRRKVIFWVLRHATRANCLTGFLRQSLARTGFTGTLEVIPWGVDAKQFPFAEKALSNPIRFLHVGNLVAVKDQAMLLHAFANIAHRLDAQLTIVGEGPLENKLKSMVEELKLSDVVRFIGTVPYHRMNDFYKESDVLLHTSLSEGQSEAVTEALSTGLLVCGTRVGLIHDLAPNACIGSEVGDANALADAVIQILSEPEAMMRIRRAAEKWTKQHDIHWTVRQYANLYVKA